MAYTDIDKPSDYFNTVLYTGNNSSTSITGVGFQPDLSWFKTRSAANGHTLIDSVRGITKRLASHNTQAEITQSDMLESFDSDGFTLGDDSNNYTNWSGKTWVAWNWKAGTSFTNDASATGIGTIDSTGSVNTDAGFSIVSYTGNGSAGATIAHGLGVAPKMIIVKNRSATSNWVVYNENLGNNKAMFLDLTDASATSTGTFNSTSPTSSVFTVGSASSTNGSGNNLIAYCFAEKQGYSKVSGSYIGNGSNNGSFCYTGMKPSFVMIKRTDSSASWLMFDNKRANPFNEITADVRADLSNAEDASTSYNNLDFLSNGFKIRKNNADINASGGNYIFMCFAENPFVTSTGVPATAR